jgi:hypothetical protein
MRYGNQTISFNRFDAMSRALRKTGRDIVYRRVLAFPAMMRPTWLATVSVSGAKTKAGSGRPRRPTHSESRATSARATTTSTASARASMPRAGIQASAARVRILRLLLRTEGHPCLQSSTSSGKLASSAIARRGSGKMCVPFELPRVGLRVARAQLDGLEVGNKGALRSWRAVLHLSSRTTRDDS